jgi:hypothetical protein
LSFIDWGFASPLGIVVLQAPLCPFLICVSSESLYLLPPFSLLSLLSLFCLLLVRLSKSLPAADGLLHIFQPAGLRTWIVGVLFSILIK